MALVLLIARMLLSAVFLVAGIAKLADLAGSRQALRDFGVPAALADLLGVLLPLAELAVAVALLLPITAWWGAVGALALLLMFVIGIGFNLARGRQPDCHCFGQLHSAPAGWPTLIRNLVLAAVATAAGPHCTYLVQPPTAAQEVLPPANFGIFLLVLLNEHYQHNSMERVSVPKRIPALWWTACAHSLDAVLPHLDTLTWWRVEQSHPVWGVSHPLVFCEDQGKPTFFRIP
jgi:uncharacterized membrane protein YphA (DoxX/SURF4 family)